MIGEQIYKMWQQSWDMLIWRLPRYIVTSVRVMWERHTINIQYKEIEKTTPGRTPELKLCPLIKVSGRKFFVRNQQNTNCIGSHTAYVAFTLLGDYWWVSSPIPCFCANKRNITFGSNIKNKTDNVNSEISQSLFEIRKYNDSFYVLTNDQSVAGYIFGSLHPNRVWEFLYNVSW